MLEALEMETPQVQAHLKEIMVVRDIQLLVQALAPVAGVALMELEAQEPSVMVEMVEMALHRQLQDHP
jgi:hypothetical protein